MAPPCDKPPLLRRHPPTPLAPLAATKACPARLPPMRRPLPLPPLPGKPSHPHPKSLPHPKARSRPRSKPLHPSHPKHPEGPHRRFPSLGLCPRHRNGPHQAGRRPEGQQGRRPPPPTYHHPPQVHPANAQAAQALGATLGGRSSRMEVRQQQPRRALQQRTRKGRQQQRRALPQQRRRTPQQARQQQQARRAAVLPQARPHPQHSRSRSSSSKSSTACPSHGPEGAETRSPCLPPPRLRLPHALPPRTPPRHHRHHSRHPHQGLGRARTHPKPSQLVHQKLHPSTPPPHPHTPRPHRRYPPKMRHTNRTRSHLRPRMQ